MSIAGAGNVDPGPKPELKGPENPDEVAEHAVVAQAQAAADTGFWDAYHAYEQKLRGWLVAYGIGAPVLFASQAAFANVIKSGNVAAEIVLTFLAGVMLQILLAMVYKYCMFYIYCGEEDRAFKDTVRYKISDFITNQTWIDVLADLASIGLYVWATLRVLFLTLQVSPPATVSVNTPFSAALRAQVAAPDVAKNPDSTVPSVLTRVQPSSTSP
jgi:hypothetical protein